MIYTFVTVFFIAVLSDTLQVRGLLQVYLRQYFSSERNLFRFLQSKDKFGSHTFCTDHINILVMCIDDLFDYRKSKSGAFTVFSAGCINFVETIPDFAQAFFGNAGSVIFYRNEDLTAFYSWFNLNRGIIIAEFNGIIKKVVKDLLNLFHISSDIKFMSGENTCS